jgi:pyruvate kinase
MARWKNTLTIGEPIGTTGGTNTLKIVRVGEHPPPHLDEQ